MSVRINTKWSFCRWYITSISSIHSDRRCISNLWRATKPKKFLVKLLVLVIVLLYSTEKIKELLTNNRKEMKRKKIPRVWLFSQDQTEALQEFTIRCILMQVYHLKSNEVNIEFHCKSLVHLTAYSVIINFHL